MFSAPSKICRIDLICWPSGLATVSIYTCTLVFTEVNCVKLEGLLINPNVCIRCTKARINYHLSLCPGRPYQLQIQLKRFNKLVVLTGFSKKKKKKTEAATCCSSFPDECILMGFSQKLSDSLSGSSFFCMFYYS